MKSVRTAITSLTIVSSRQIRGGAISDVGQKRSTVRQATFAARHAIGAGPSGKQGTRDLISRDRCAVRPIEFQRTEPRNVVGRRADAATRLVAVG